MWYILTGAYAVYPQMNLSTGNGGVIHYQMLTSGATKIISHDSATELYIMYYFFLVWLHVLDCVDTEAGSSKPLQNISSC